MTVLDAAPTQAGQSTATGPTARSVLRSARGPLVVLLALVVTGTAVGAYYATGPKDRLDPASYSPDGAHAIAVLLDHRDVRVHRVETVDAVVPGSNTTVFVPEAAALSAAEVARVTSLPVRLVIVGASDPQLTQLGVSTGPTVDVQTRAPACALPAATRAGDATMGGLTYRDMAAGTGCYATAGRATLLDLPARGVTLLGSGDLFTNGRLDRRGNAALALGLLGRGSSVQWLLPRPGARDVASDRSLNDLVPMWLKLAVLQLAVAAAWLALWRARSLGPVVSEPLPVVVRAAEAVEGRSRLYRAARARATAAEALRAGARQRLALRLGLGPDAARDAVVAAVVARTGHDPAALDALLYGAAPTDDDALVRLADDLDLLLLEVAGT
jgi:hypothetical protein